MVIHTQIIRRLLSTNGLRVLNHSVGLALKELREKLRKALLTMDINQHDKSYIYQFFVVYMSYSSLTPTILASLSQGNSA